MGSFKRFIFMALLPCLISAQNPPKIDNSYKAMGEMVEDLDGTTIQMAFEEHYDNTTGDAAFTVWQFGKNITFLENAKNEETLEIMNDKLCAVATKQDWIDTDSPPSLIGYNSTGAIRFSLRILLDLNTKYLVASESGKNDTYRNFPAQSFMYEIPGSGADKDAKITVYAFYSDPTWSTTSDEGQVPLGFEITKISKVDKKMVSTVQVINVFGFLKNVVDQKAFKAKEGIVCIGRKQGMDLPNFPLVMSLTLRSEYILKGYKLAKTMDTYFDVDNGFLRVDLDRMDGKREVEGMGKYARPYSSTISVKDTGISYSLKSSKNGLDCIVQLTKDYEFDPQEVINPLASNWSIHTMIGRGTTKYVYLGKGNKRNMPCHLYQGNRTDWPDPSKGIVSVWEWCFAIKLNDDDEYVNYQDKEIGLVSASVLITKSSNTMFPEGYTMTHHFYDVINKPRDSMVLSTFDISRCFKPDEKYYMEFLIDAPISDATLDFYKNATSNNDFLVPWKNAITAASKTNPNNLRIAGVQALIIKKKLYIDFILLGLHRNLPDVPSAKALPTLDAAYKFIQEAVEGGTLKIDYNTTANKKGTLKAVKGSLKRFFRSADEFKPFPLQSTTSTSPTTVKSLPPFSIVTESEAPSSPDIQTESVTGASESTVSEQTESTVSGMTSESSTAFVSASTEPTTTMKITDTPVIFVGHTKGTVAGVSIAMILLGFSIGAGGTFYKFKGMPRFLQFR